MLKQNQPLTTPLLICLLFFMTSVNSLLPGQNNSTRPERRSLNAIRVSQPPHIDGRLDEEAWLRAETASNFFQYEPHNDRAASLTTEVRVLYDDNNLYIGARMFDPEPGLILTELGLRDADDNLNADTFWIELNPFDDGIYGFSFKVSASGVQSDANISHGTSGRGGDRNWDAVWKSAVQINTDGWQAEIRIPYSALRFPRYQVQAWGINFWREIRRSRESSSWNFVDRRIADRVASMGLLTGISDVRPPLRLAFFPYTSAYLEKNGAKQGWAGSFNGGMDIKYGLNESFTLDTTLIPDFGQVQSDALVLNLSPYEVKYDEKRQFFTEGTELFNKAELFYSRRIGARPRGYGAVYSQMSEDEILLANPLETRLINATKLTGRTRGGLGIGVFNAMTGPARALVRDRESGEERHIVTQPFSNYSLLVLDQSLRNNSFISLVNANVAGLEDGYTSNVSGAEFRFLDNSRAYRISGSAALSQQYRRETDDSFGYKYRLSLGRFAGTWQYSYTRNLVSDSYNQNDLGYLRRNNEFSDSISFSHNVFSPFWKLNNMSHGLSLTRNSLFKPREFTSLSLGYNLRLLFRDRFMLVLRLNYQPRGEKDFYEPRVPGRFYQTDSAWDLFVMYSSDYRRRVYVDGEFTLGRTLCLYRQDFRGLKFTPTLRISDRLNLALGFEYGTSSNEIGYAEQRGPDEVYFGRRNGTTIVNSIRSSYIFSNVLSLSFSLRHYWSRVAYPGEYFFLNPNGRLAATDIDLELPDINFNSFTLDTKLTWNFAPGSQLSLVWKNAIDSLHSEILHDYFRNARFFLGQPQINSLSIKILYYLDHKSFSRP